MLRKIISVFLVLTICAGILLPVASAAERSSEPEEPVVVLASSTGAERINLDFNEDWKFQLGDVTGAESKSYDDSGWRVLDLPHDYSIEQDFQQGTDVGSGALPGGIGWYRKTFVLPAAMAGKRISLDFGGVYMDSTTYVNGTMVGNYPYGYSPFSYDITDYVVADGVTENVVAVRVNNQLPSSRWYSGSGIYRSVQMVVTEPVHVARYGTYITTPDLETDYTAGKAHVNAQTEVENDGNTTVEAVVTSTILDQSGEVFATGASSEVKTIAPGETAVYEQVIETAKPQLWSVDSPNLYTMKTTVTVDGMVVDTYSTTFGFRWLTFTTDDGFYLNGEYMKLNGVCMHHDQGALGAVANYRAIERQMETMKEMGVNAIRVTHNPASDELLEICNRLGLMVIDEAFDCWESGKRANDYGRFFNQAATHPDAEPGETWAEFDIKNMVNRGKNDPCIIMWSLGNEIVGASVATAQKLNGWVKEVDTTRPTTQGYNNFIGSFGDSNMKKVADVSDVAGFNYGESGSNPSYDQAHIEYPDWVIMGSETSSAVRSRGYYQNNDALHIRSSYDDSGTVGWGSSMEHAWQMNRDRKWILGEFMWTGFDYIGEPSPYSSWPSKSSYFGAVDTAGIPKDAFYMYQSVWTSVEDNPMVHLMPHWNWEGDAGYDIKDSEGRIRVQAYTNAPAVELFLNGESLGKKVFEQLTTSDGRPYQELDGHIYLEWLVTYEPGELKAVAYDEEDNVIATDIICTSGEPAQVRLTPDREVITADGKDLSYILVEVLDKDGNLVPTADNLINFQISGNGIIAGVDNGNQTAVDERYKDDKRKAFSGKAMLIVQSTTEEGGISITASSAGLQSDSVNLFTTAAETEVKLLGYEALADVTTSRNVQPDLPQTVNAVYSDGTKIAKAVSWEQIDSSLLGQAGRFVVQGTVTETGDRMSIYVIVADYIGIKDTVIVTAVGTIPQLPETVTAVYNTGEANQVAVQWERSLTDDDVATEGNVVIEGTVDGFANKARAEIRVRASEQIYSQNIAVKSGDYPIPTASYVSNDPVSAINDGAIYFNGGPSGGRWIPWGHNQETEWCQLELQEAHTIGKVGISIWNNITDDKMSLPDTLTIQYSDNGQDWIDIAAKTRDEIDNVDGNMDGKAMKEVVFDFSDEPVTTKYIRWKFDNAARKSTGVGEVHVYEAVEKIDASSVAELESILLDGVPLEGFDTATTFYSVEIPYGAALPVVTATAKDNGTVFVIPALSAGQSTAVEVTSEDGTASQTYSIYFRMAAPVLDRATISLSQGTVTEDDVVPIALTALLQDGTELSQSVLEVNYQVSDPLLAKVQDGNLYAYNEGTVTIRATVRYQGVTVQSAPLEITIAKNDVEKTITGYAAVTVTTDKGVAPQLPATVMATFDQGLSKPVLVNWDPIDEAAYANYGSFVVSGTVEGQALRPTAKVLVKGIVGVETFSMATPVRYVPDLPDKATVYYSDGTSDEMAVTWEECTQDDFAKVGSLVTITGTVAGTPLGTQITVRVSDQTRNGDVFTQYKNGFYLPLPFASFTNNASGASDHVSMIYDKTISYTNNPSNRWSNWQSSARTGEEYVGIVFGLEEVTERFIDNLDVYFFADSGVSAPASCRVQYYVGAPFTRADISQCPVDELEPDHLLAQEGNWADVPNLQAPETLTGNACNSFTFDAVKTCAIRIVMTPQEGKSLGITEMESYAQLVDDVKTQASISEILIDGKTLPGFDPDIYTYTYQGENGLPVITATAAGENAAVTVISPVYEKDGANPVAKVIATAEDGLTKKEYRITLLGAPVTYTITAIQSEGGAISPEKATVEEGGQVFFTITANEGYEIADVLVDGKSEGKADCYLFENVTANHSITAEFKAVPSTGIHTVTLNPNGGTVRQNTIEVEDGETTFLPTPYRAGSYRFLGWFDANGKQYTASTPITEDVTLTAHWQYTGGGTHVDPEEPSKPVEPSEPEGYYDVSVGDWYYDAVSYVTEEGLMTGVGNGKFNPNGAVTRAMVWTVLARMDGENTDGGATWYSKAQSWAMRTGVSDGTNPMGSITREQLAAMLYRYEGSPAVSGNLNAYPDANEVSDWAVDAMVWATQEGIINGMNGYLKPQAGATRAQLAAMLMRFEEA